MNFSYFNNINRVNFLKLVFLMIFLNGSNCFIFSQSCLPQGIQFITQEQIDSFQNNYPGCTHIQGDVIIGDNFWTGNISNLDGLAVLDSIGGDLFIDHNTELQNLFGLSGIIKIGGLLEISYNQSIPSLEGLNNLEKLGGNLKIEGNLLIEDLSPLSSLTSITQYQVIIESNPALNDISGINSIDPNSIVHIIIKFNYSLSNCAIDLVCNYLGLFPEDVYIYGNALGCNSLPELTSACFSSIGDNRKVSAFQIRPNPVNDYCILSIYGTPQHNTLFQIFDLAGKEIKRYSIESNVSGLTETQISIYNLMPGVYVCKVSNPTCAITQRVIKL